MNYFNTRISAVKGVLYDFEKSIASEPNLPWEKAEQMAAQALGYINSLTELKGIYGNKTSTKARVQNKGRKTRRP